MLRNKTAKFVFDGVENIVGKGENTGYQHYLLFPQCFQKLSSFRVVLNWDHEVIGLVFQPQMNHGLVKGSLAHYQRTKF